MRIKEINKTDNMNTKEVNQIANMTKEEVDKIANMTKKEIDKRVRRAFENALAFTYEKALFNFIKKVKEDLQKQDKAG